MLCESGSFTYLPMRCDGAVLVRPSNGTGGGTEVSASPTRTCSPMLVGDSVTMSSREAGSWTLRTGRALGSPSQNVGRLKHHCGTVPDSHRTSPGSDQSLQTGPRESMESTPQVAWAARPCVPGAARPCRAGVPEVHRPRPNGGESTLAHSLGARTNLEYNLAQALADA